jgi:hypothetical protein
VHKRQRWWHMQRLEEASQPLGACSCRLAADVAHLTVLTNKAYSRVEMTIVDSGLLNLSRRHSAGHLLTITILRSRCSLCSESKYKSGTLSNVDLTTRKHLQALPSIMRTQFEHPASSMRCTVDFPSKQCCSRISWLTQSALFLVWCYNRRCGGRENVGACAPVVLS